jgi:large subunit ribosomal protein L1
MGKTKTAILTGTDDQQVKPSYDKAAKEAKRKAKEAELARHKTEKVEKKEDRKPVEHVNEVHEEVAVESSPATESADKKAKVRSQNYKSSLSKINKNQEYALSEAIALVKESSYSKFDGTIELHIVIRKEGFSTNVTLPHSFGKQKKVEVATDATIEKLKAGKIEFDVLLATPDMMPKLVAFARLLGPRGMMPNPKNGTIIKSAKDADNFSTAATTIKTEKSAPVIHMGVGKVSQDNDKINANIETVLNAINKKQVQKMYLSSTMSPSVKVKVA